MNMRKLQTHCRILLENMDGYSTQSREDAPIPDCRLADNDNSNTLDLLDILQTCYFDRSDLDTACLDMSPINDQPWSIWNTPRMTTATLKQK